MAINWPALDDAKLNRHYQDASRRNDIVAPEVVEKTGSCEIDMFTHVMRV